MKAYASPGVKRSMTPSAMKYTFQYFIDIWAIHYYGNISDSQLSNFIKFRIIKFLFVPSSTDKSLSCPPSHTSTCHTQARERANVNVEIISRAAFQNIKVKHQLYIKRQYKAYYVCMQLVILLIECRPNSNAVHHLHCFAGGRATAPLLVYTGDG